ncbi:purine nucleoside permease [Phenylobacterium sp.]|uniref:purine-nucleoside phosphorylase n=1 Tax=Phenylobacterium sp. TaxID=1871053 RepID=UPI0025F65C40|nr:purine nucleoside permease [Phenylobacterium sp.]
MLRLLVLIAALLAPGLALAKPMLVKVVVLTTFESGASAAKKSGEFQAWAARYPLTHPLKVPGIEGRVLYSEDGVLGVVTGMRARARESVAALLLDPELDLSHAYWIVAGIAGVDPRAGSIGSAAWANYVVDADPIFELDDRETPKDWPWGLYALATPRPGIKGSAPGSSGMVWRMDPGLTQWAYQLTKDVPLADNPHLAATRARFKSEPAAQTLPHVFIGDDLGTVRFWHGDLRTQWARDWVKIWTDGHGVFAMSACEDQGIMDVLTLFGDAGKLDIRRVLMLRTGSNYTREGDGEAQVVEFTEGGAAAAFEAAYLVGSPVVKALVAGWDRYGTTIPQAKP